MNNAPFALGHGRFKALRRRAFTLVELLVVIGIMGMMLAITVTAFEGVGKGAKLRAALAELKTTLSLARQYAITDRQIVFVVFPCDQVNLSDSTNLAFTRYSSYCLCTTGRWSRMLNQWHHLPKGVIFDRVRTPPPGRVALGYVNVFDRSVSNNLSTIPFPIEASNQVDQTVTVVRFNPNGRLHTTQDSTPVIFVTEGSVRVNPTTAALVDYMIQPGAPSFMLEVRPLTGRVKITELSP